MAMQINGSYDHFGTDYAERVKERQAVPRAEKAEKAAEGCRRKKSGKLSEPQDEYISSERFGKKPTEKCVTNTDKVDREIKKLKKEKQQLEQQLQSISGDEKKTRELEKKLAQVEKELSQKDNDTYRRQNASVSE